MQRRYAHGPRADDSIVRYKISTSRRRFLMVDERSSAFASPTGRGRWPRLARLVLPGVAHPMTQRSNGRGQTFFGDDDYRAYRDLLAE